MEPTEVKILDDRPVTHFPKPGQPVIVRAITYQLGQGVPRVVYVPEAEYSEERVRMEIREDLKRAATQGARTMRL